MKTASGRIHSMESIYNAEPQLLKSVLKALGEELKKMGKSSGRVVNFLCPNCDARLGVMLKQSKRQGEMAPVKMRRSNFASGVNKVVLRLAKLRGCMTADIHRDFTKLLGSKANKLSKEEYRKKKLAWLRVEIAKFRRSRKSRAA